MSGFYSNQKALKESTFILDKFLGCDFTQGDFITDYRRSPNSKNLIWGVNPYLPKMRKGYRPVTIRQTNLNNAPININGIHHFGDDIIVHVGNKLCKIVGNDREDGKLIYQAMTMYPSGNKCIMDNTKSVSFQFEATIGGNVKTCLYILGGGRYLRYDGTNLQDVKDVAYVPTTVVGRTSAGGGINKEGINILSDSQIYTFYVEEEECEELVLTSPTSPASSVQLEKGGVRNLAVYKQTNTGDVEIYNYTLSSGARDTVEFTDALDANTNYRFVYLAWKSDKNFRIGTGYTIDYVKVNGSASQYTYEYGLIKFTNAVAGNRGSEGVDNIEVKFTKNSTETKNFLWEAGVMEYPCDSKFVIIKDVLYNGTALSEEYYEYNPQDKKIHFLKKPSKTVDGTTTDIEVGETVTIQFRRPTKIEKCSIYDIFGGKNDTRVFVAGNEDYPNCDWYSALYDAEYFPDINYTYIGTSSNKIMGYIKQYDTQMIIKEDNAYEASAYLRRYSIDSDGNYSFPVEQGITGVGAVSKRSFGYLNGEPLFLSSKGIVGIEGTNVDYRNLCQDRSEKINSKLLQNTNLKNAFSIDYNNKYLLFISNTVYIADARMMYTDALGRHQYEWFFWDNIEAECAEVINGELYFGNNGIIYKFKEDGDNNVYTDELENGEVAIKATWETPRLYFGSISNKKCAANIFCFCDETVKSRVRIKAIADEREIDLGNYDNSTEIDFNMLDLENFPFFGLSDDEVKKIHSSIQRFTSIKFLFETETKSIDESLGFGLKLLQVNYLYL